jgi:hydrogen peroxide-dependent heme synthase
MPDLPAVPLTLEGSSVLHQMFHFDWSEWRNLDFNAQSDIATEVVGLFARWEQQLGRSCSALFSLLGHKGDLLLIHFRNDFKDLNRIELELAQTRFSDYLTPSYSYLSMVELGLYESSAKTYASLAEKGFLAGTPEWNAGVREVLDRQATAMAKPLNPAIPDAKYVCFYPMDRKRAETVNWYTQPMAERQRMMHEHGLIGRRYADSVRQVINGSIGFDDWEWGVDLFADHPLVFKKLIYEMRFDQVSAVYAEFGEFFIGLRLPVSEFRTWLVGKLL